MYFPKRDSLSRICDYQEYVHVIKLWSVSFKWKGNDVILWASKRSYALVIAE